MERASRTTTMGVASQGGWHSLPNHAVEPTPNSLHFCVAPAIGRGSPPALGNNGSNATLLSCLLKEESQSVRSKQKGRINMDEGIFGSIPLIERAKIQAQ